MRAIDFHQCLLDAINGCDSNGVTVSLDEAAELFNDIKQIMGDAERHNVPDYETPEQYEKRTGKPWPDEGAVWFRKSDYSDADFVWGVCRYTTAKRCGDRDVVCVQGPNPPPDDWRPV
jgi:hypothetical protein